MISVLYMPAEGQPEKVEISGSLESMQKLVGGYIQIDPYNSFARLLSVGAQQSPESFADEIKFLLPSKKDVRFDPAILLICNEESIPLGLPPNQNVIGIRGNCFLARAEDID